MADRRGAYWVLVWIPEGKRALGRPRCRYEDNTKMYSRSRMRGMNWIDLAQEGDRYWELVRVEMDFRSYKMENFLSS
jgi:hypothetical protein